jgi:hypothetical protein
MQRTTRRALKPAIWLGLLAGWVVSGVVVAITGVGGGGAVVAFCVGAVGVGGFVYDRQQRRNQIGDPDDVPGPWDGQAWEGWLLLASQVLLASVVLRILAAVPWSREWTEILWRIDS